MVRRLRNREQSLAFPAADRQNVGGKLFFNAPLSLLAPTLAQSNRRCLTRPVNQTGPTPPLERFLILPAQGSFHNEKHNRCSEYNESHCREEEKQHDTGSQARIAKHQQNRNEEIALEASSASVADPDGHLHDDGVAKFLPISAQVIRDHCPHADKKDSDGGDSPHPTTVFRSTPGPFTIRHGDGLVLCVLPALHANGRRKFSGGLHLFNNQGRAGLERRQTGLAAQLTQGRHGNGSAARAHHGRPRGTSRYFNRLAACTAQVKLHVWTAQ